jgi:hypothetical protein
MTYLWLAKTLTRVGRHNEASAVLREGLKLTPATADDQQSWKDLRQLQSDERL